MAEGYKGQACVDIEWSRKVNFFCLFLFLFFYFHHHFLNKVYLQLRLRRKCW